MLTSIEVTIDKSGYLHSAKPGQAIKHGGALLAWMEPDTAPEPAFMAETALNPDNPLAEIGQERPLVVSLSNHVRPFDKLRANGFLTNGLSGLKQGRLNPEEDAVKHEPHQSRTMRLHRIPS